MLLKDKTKDELKKLSESNNWLGEKIYEYAYDGAMLAQEDDFKMIGADCFEYHDHYSSFYLTTPTIYGAKAPEKIAGKLDAEYLSEEDAKLYKELCGLIDKWENMTTDEEDEHPEIYEQATEKCDVLAEHLTQYFRDYENITDEQIEQVLDEIIEGWCWLGDLEEENGKIKEVVYYE